MARIKILLADDHAMFREGIRDLLQRCPDFHIVGEASDGNEAIRIADEHLPDVVLMDIGMPVVTGLEATRIIKAKHPHINVLVLTIHEEDEYLLELLRAGASGYVLKKATGEELIQSIRAIKAGGLFLNRSVGRRLVGQAFAHRYPGGSEPSTVNLTPREAQVLKLAAKGMINQQIATELGIGVATVKGHLVNVFEKMGVESRTEAVLQALRQGLIGLEDTL